MMHIGLFFNVFYQKNNPRGAFVPLFVELSTSDRFSSGGKKAISCCGSQTSDGETVIKTPITETQIDFFFYHLFKSTVNTNHILYREQNEKSIVLNLVQSVSCLPE